MKKNRKPAIAALVLGVFFLFQSGAEIFFAIGKDRDPGKGLKNLRRSIKLFPLAAVFFNEAGFSQLRTGTANRDAAAVKKSVPYFKAALKRNPLDYQSRYYLSNAYLQLSSSGGDFFDTAVAELKRAALIRGNNKQIALDCSRVFFSIWPLLEPGDQGFASRLLANAMPRLSWAEFSPLLEMWSLYVQDTPLLMELLQKKPVFFAPAANQLVASGIPLAERRELLNLHEIYALDVLERRLNELGLQGAMTRDEAKALLKQSLQIRGYYRLQSGSKFDAEKLARIRRLLRLEVISGFLRDPQLRTAAGAMRQLRENIQAYIAGHSELGSLDELQKLLEENDYFKDNDFSSLYLKTLIAYKKGNYGDVISQIEALRSTISFVKKEQAADYTAILLLLIDSYYESKLLTAAESVARELYENQPDNSDILFRILRIRNILGVEGAADADLDAKLETVTKSRFITVVRA
ncbi:MAG: hypothetical protein PHX05_10240, partial [Acidobacteriota bacterium]|nr:hypothetical protein [Acidobacteriota bacterium]